MRVSVRAVLVLGIVLLAAMIGPASSGERGTPDP